MSIYKPPIAATTDLPKPPAVESDRAHLFSAGVVGMLLLLASVTGGLVGGTAMICAMFAKSPASFEIGFIVGALVTIFSWLVLIWRWFDLTAPVKPQPITTPSAPGTQKTTRLEVSINDGKYGKVQYPVFPCSEETFTKLARSALNGKTFSERNWTHGSNPFTRGKNGSFGKMRDALMARGYITEAGGYNGGTKWTDLGLLVMQAWLDRGPPPPPDQE